MSEIDPEKKYGAIKSSTFLKRLPGKFPQESPSGNKFLYDLTNTEQSN